MFDDVGPMTEDDVNEAIKVHEDEGWEVVSQKLASCYDGSSFQCFLLYYYKRTQKVVRAMWLKNEVGGVMQNIILDYDRFALNILKEELESRNPKNYQWKAKDGTVLNVKDMTDSHLKNAINLLEKYVWEQEIIQECGFDPMDCYD